MGQSVRAGDCLRAQEGPGLGSAADRAVQGEAGPLGLADLLEVTPAQLSKGSARKVGLAQALLVAPGLLVFDEPWCRLDAAARDNVARARPAGRAGRQGVVVADHQQQVASLAP